MLELLEIDTRILKIYSKDIVPPNFFYSWESVTTENFSYTFPPFFIPLFVDVGSPLFIGVVFHPFSQRKKVFVKYDLTLGYMWEIARNAEQMLLDVLIKSIEMNDDIIDKEVLNFSNIIGLQIDEKFKTTYENYYDGNPYSTYINFDLFSKNTPAAYIHNVENYNGDFPSIKTKINQRIIYLASEFEIDKEIKDLNLINNLPKWLVEKNRNKTIVFDELLDDNCLDQAWLVLNSKGWFLEDAKKKLVLFKQRNKDNLLFNLVVDNWIEGFSNPIFKHNDYY